MMNGDDRQAFERQSVDERVGEAERLDGNAAAGILSEVFVQTSQRRAPHAPTAAPSGRWERCSSTLTAWAR
jgi:hypothetical protein